ncbi:hypothetical protein KB559_10900 [Paenibacillus sp. Marseille-P2973]|uniref:hypothetical protein n=1 Tax=Paenibacillus sp. Marseille-P2973 TaxID=1871032 RepID=UPI001B38A282|nr:hypothetical protein [Paenibacillus sp. Marseille-P2973]MBQ4899345.1 hypothetical protein [Paenibacillus sp. Marseille-P2973]
MKESDFNHSRDIREMLKKLSMASNEFSNRYRAAISPISEALNTFKESIASLSIPKIELPQFPKLSGFEWDEFYKEFEEECKSNAKHGWCLSAEMDIPDYRRIGSSEDNQKTKDYLFTELFEVNDFELYNYEKNSIINESSNGWQEFYKDCFHSIENGRLMVAIPSLMMVIEHELSNGIDIDLSGKPLVRSVKSSIEQEREPGKFTTIIATSLFSLLENGIFERGITGPRSELINRNRVLHGRDDPSKWTKTDAYRLITIISALKMLKDYK